jgi:hypothetical protein
VTELALREETDSGLVLWAEEARAAASVAQSLAKTSFVPKSLRCETGPFDEQYAVTVANITAAILTGQEVGLSPMAALRSIDIIEGVPAMRAIAMRALVQSHGHDVWTEGTPTPAVAVICGRRKGSEHTERREWTIEKARRNGFTTNRKGETKTNWKNQPENMLVARATSEVCRLIAADVLLGMPYSIEELLDAQEQDEAPKPARKVKRQPLAAVIREATEPEPEIEAPQPEMTEPDFDPETGELIPEGAVG